MMDIVITGLGLVSPLGENVQTSWAALLSGEEASGPVTLFSTDGCRCQRAAQAKLPMRQKTRPRWSRATHLAVTAAAEALNQAGLLDNSGLSILRNLPLSLSTTGGNMTWGEEFVQEALLGKRRRQLTRVARYQPQQQALDLQAAFGFSDETFIVANACASGANALGHAADMIQAGEAECVLAGGCEALSELIFVGFDSLQAMSVTQCRPFDRQRNGLLMGEGAAFIVLESRTHAAQRKAVPLARLAGYGHTTDLHHLTQPAPQGGALVQAMKSALIQSGLKSSDLTYVNAHGTGTPMNDGAEAAAYAAFFSETDPAKISSTKAAIGHTLGAAGAIEAVFALLAGKTGQLPPQLHLQEPLPEIAQRLVSLHERTSPGPVMSVNLGFGGSNAALIFTSP